MKGGDPALLQKMTEELQRLKNKSSQQDLGQVTDKLQQAEEIARLGEKNRDLERKVLALQRRNQELEDDFAKKMNSLEDVTNDLSMYKTEFDGV